MACNYITKGKRAAACADSVGGVKNLYFAIYADYGMTRDGQEVSALGSLDEVFKYELIGTGQGLTETYTPNADNMTAFVAQAFNATFQGIDAETEKELLLILKHKSIVFAEDYNGNVKVMGYENGAMGSGGTAVFGSAKGDLNGYTVEFTAEEKEYAPLLTSSAKTALTAAVVNSYI